MINRTIEDICLLCQVNKATAKNSHFTPAALIASAIGKRDYEDSKRIDAGGEKPLDSFFGRSNIKNTDPEIKPHHHAADYIFCPACEKKLAILESEINPLLTKKLKDPNQAVNYPEQKHGHVRIITCKSVSAKLLFLYFYSVIWRQSLQQQLEKEGTIVLSNEQQESLRKVLSSSLCATIPEYDKVSFEVIPLFVLTADKFEDSTTNLIMPHSKFINPYCFVANEFLISVEFPAATQTPAYFNLDRRIFVKELLNSDLNTPFKIGIVAFEEWKEFLKHTADHEAEKFIRKYVIQLSEQTGLGQLRCKILLCSCATAKNKTSGRLFGEDFIDCYEDLLKKYTK